MGVDTLREISLRNHDSAWGANSPRGRYNNSWGMFLVPRTCPHINEFITQGNCKMNADGLFSSLSTMYEMGKLHVWDKRQRTAHLNWLVSNSLQQRPVNEPRCHFYACTNVLSVTSQVMSVTAPVMSITPLLRASRPCCEHHTPVTSVTPCYKPVARGYFK